MSTADDDEKTITGPPTPGRERAGMQPGHTLPPGTRLRDYEITGLIGEGGFGIVYLAWDHSLQRKVAIKEYMPASMAARVSGSSAIVVKSERHLDTFRAGLKSFVNEARLLARFDHPSLVKVYRFWEENGTAYMVMPYYEGPTLKAALAAMDRPPSEAELRAWLRPLLDALTVMHASHCYHRDIAPDNILLTSRGPLLLDFGAARRVIGDMTHAITVVLKPGFAPIEQYGDVATMAQGAWTDLYALASVVYYAITGRTPISSVERLMDDRLEPLAVSAAGRYSAEFLRAIDAALAVRPAARPQDARELRALLGLGQTPTADDGAGDSGWSSGWASGYGMDPGSSLPDPSARIHPPGTATSEDTVVATQARTPSTIPETVAPPAASAPPLEPARSPRRGRYGAWAAGIGALVVVLAIIGWLQPRSAGPAAPRDVASAAAPTPGPQAPAAPPPAIESPPMQTPATQTPPTQLPERAVVAPAPAPSAVLSVERRASSTPLASDDKPAPSVEAQSEPSPERSEPRSAATRSEAPSRASEAAASVASPPVQRAARAHRESSTQRGDPTAAPTRPPTQASNSRCSDILQKASLEPLTASEAAYLKSECR